jgi:hypothetical protein
MEAANDTVRAAKRIAPLGVFCAATLTSGCSDMPRIIPRRKLKPDSAS